MWRLVCDTGPCYDGPMDGLAHARTIAAWVIPAYRPLGGLSFAYGQGSVVTGFTAQSDIDLVLVWDRAAPPAPEARPAHRLNEGAQSAKQFHQPGSYLDQFCLGARSVDVAHIPKTVFTGWLNGCVRNGTTVVPRRCRGRRERGPPRHQATASSVMTVAQRSWKRHRRSARETCSPHRVTARKYWRCSSKAGQKRVAEAKEPKPRIG